MHHKDGSLTFTVSNNERYATVKRSVNLYWEKHDAQSTDTDHCNRIYYSHNLQQNLKKQLVGKLSHLFLFHVKQHCYAIQNISETDTVNDKLIMIVLTSI